MNHERDFEDRINKIGLSAGLFVEKDDGSDIALNREATYFTAMRFARALATTPPNATPTVLEMLGYELDGVLIDTKNDRFDDICRRTVERVRHALATLAKEQA